MGVIESWEHSVFFNNTMQRDSMKRFLIILAALLAAASALAMQEDQPKEPAHFVFTIENTAKGVSFACEKGGAWKTLGFLLHEAEVFINQNGMVDDKTNKRGGTWGFLMGIASRDGKMELSCKAGCAWEILSYAPASSARKIDDMGVWAK